MIAGTLEVQMMAQMARLAADMRQAKGVVGDAMGEIEKAVGAAKSALGALGIGVGIGALIALAKGGIDAADRLNDLSKSTNIAVGDLAGLRLLAKQTGTDLDGLAKGINRMSVEMGKDPEKFRQLGITAKDNVGAFKQFADIFNQLPDINQRNALSQAVFAKSWQDLAPALSEGGAKIGEVIDKGKQLSGMTPELAKQADDFNDKMAELTGTGRLFATVFGPLLPLLNAMADDLITATSKTADFKNEINPLLEVMKTLVILGGNVSFVFTTMGKDMARAAENIQLIVTGKWEESRKLGELFKKDAEEARKALDEWEKKIMALGKSQAGLSQAGAGNGATPATDAAAAAAAAAARAAAFLKEEKDLDSTYRGLVKTLTEKGMTERELTEIAKLQLTLDALSAKQLATITPERRKELEDLARKVDLKNQEKKATENFVKATQAEEAFQQEMAEGIASIDKARNDLILSTDRNIQQIEFENSLIGLSNEQRELAIQLRALETSGIDAQSEAYAQLKVRMVAAMNSKAALDKAQELKKQQLEEWNALWSAVERTGKDVFIRIFADGKDAFEGIGKAIKASVIDLLYQLTVRKWIINIGTSMAGSMGLITAAEAAKATGGGGMGLLSNLGSAASLWGGFSGGVGSIGAGGAVMTAAPVYEAGALLAGAETASLASGAGMSAALSAIGPVGWAAIAAGVLLGAGSLFGDEDKRQPSSIKFYKDNGLYTLDVGNISDAGQNQAEFANGPAAGMIAALNDPARYNPALLDKYLGEHGLGGPASSADALAALSQMLAPAAADSAASLQALDEEAAALASTLKDQLTDAVRAQLDATEDAARAAHRAAEAFTDISRTIGEAINALQGGDLSILDPQAKLNYARGTLQSTFDAAIGGDMEALRGLPGVANDFLSASRAYNASSSLYAADFEGVMTVLEYARGLSDSRGAAQGSLAGGFDQQAGVLSTIMDQLRGDSPDAALLQGQLGLLNGGGTVGALLSQYLNALPGHASGLDYVPRDNYLMRAHRGEAVLNASEANQWRSGEQGEQTRILKDVVVTSQQGTAETVAQLKAVVRVLTEEMQGLRTELRRIG